MPVHVSSTMCSSSVGQNCIIQHLVSSHTSLKYAGERMGCASPLFT